MEEPKSLGTKVLVIADPRANALIVRARPRDLDEIKALINKMDKEGSDTENIVQWLPVGKTRSPSNWQRS